MTNPLPRTCADIARLRAELVEARQRRADGEHRWAVARYTSSTADRPEDLDVELAHLDATIAALEEAIAADGPAPGKQTAGGTPPPDGPAKAPGRHDRLSGSGGYLASSSPVPAQPARTPNTEPEYLTTREAATLLRLSTDTLERLRAAGTGPTWKRVGRRVLYSRAGLLEFGTRK